MLSSIKDVDLLDISEALPSFITVSHLVLTYNIAEGMALGLISYTLVKVLTGRFSQVTITLYIVSGLLIARYVLQALNVSAGKYPQSQTRSIPIFILQRMLLHLS